MSHNAGSLFGMQVRVADSPEEWDLLVAAAREAGGVDIGSAVRDDYNIVIAERAGLVVCKDAETMLLLCDAIPKVTP